LIENVDVAKYVSDVLLGVNQRLIESLDTVKASGSSEDFVIYRKAVGRLSSRSSKASWIQSIRSTPC
jgi:hypothetical protein